ncbi:DoxX family protein [Streptomyces sp. B6B3]|uniref:DoxX family protein n=1 Tax=Streptomyces sp. B6B3 TaxID=3153570 RepID=UPI00325E531F
MSHPPAAPAPAAPAPAPATPTAPATAPSERLVRRLDDLRPYVLSLFRIVVGLLFTCHGFGALFGVIGPAAGPNEIGPGGPQIDTVEVGEWPLFYAAVIELVGGALLMLGVGTRVVALLCSGEMAYAYFTVHAEVDPWPIDNGGEIPAFDAWAFLLLACTGPGALALGRLRPRAGRARRARA